MSCEPHADRWLRDRRAQTGMTQEQLAQETGLTVRDIQRMEAGDLHMSYRKFLIASMHFDVSMDEFLFGKGDAE